MALDLSALDNEYGDASNDTFRNLSIDEIIEDPDQPRTQFDPDYLNELAEDIKARGLMQPILVRAPDADGKYKIIVGARRYRACKIAGLNEIPVLIRDDDLLDDYAQVAENTKRANLTALEMANFIAKRQAAGEKNAEIARKLGMDKSAITQLGALINPPPFFLELYEEGKCTNPLYFYEMKKIWNTWPEEVELWAKKSDDITRSTIKALYDKLRGPEKEEIKVTVNEQTGLSGKSGLDSGRDSEISGSSADAGNESFSNPESPEPKSEPISESTDNNQVADEKISAPQVTVIPAHNPEIEKMDDESGADPNKIKKPLLLVDYQGRAAMLLLYRRPTSSGLIHIRYEDGSGDDEVEAGSLKINLLTEASK